MDKRGFLLLMMILVIERSEGVWLNLPDSGNKCVSEQLHDNVVVLTDYVVIPDDDVRSTPTISVKVTSPFGETLHTTENVTHGQFAFTTKETGQYEACFWADPSSKRALSLSVDWKTGIAAKDWESVARKEKLEGVELELKKLEDQVLDILSNLVDLARREIDMRTLNDSTNSRVAWYSLMSLGLCIVVSAIQITHLKRFFQKKKLI